MNDEKVIVEFVKKTETGEIHKSVTFDSSKDAVLWINDIQKFDSSCTDFQVTKE